MLKIHGFTGYFGFTRSHPTGEVKMFWKVMKIQCIGRLQSMQLINLGLRLHDGLSHYVTILGIAETGSRQNQDNPQITWLNNSTVMVAGQKKRLPPITLQFGPEK